MVRIESYEENTMTKVRTDRLFKRRTQVVYKIDKYAFLSSKSEYMNNFTPQ